MTWNATGGHWQGDARFCRLWRGFGHPHGNDAVIAWKAPRTGTVTIEGTIERFESPIDGSRARIFKKAQKIWPSHDWQRVYPSFMVRHVVMTDVKAGDILYFHINERRTASYDTTSWDPIITYDKRPPFLLDGARFVMNDDDLDRVSIDNLDASLSVLPGATGQRLVWFHSEHMGSHHQKFVGSLDKPAKELVFEKSLDEFFVRNPTNADGRWWITNIYRHTDNSLLGFIHVEVPLEDDKGVKFFRIGLAHSTNEGDSWVYLGHIITMFDDPPPNTNEPTGLNITGTPYLIKDGYFYIYFADRGGACVARAPVAQVMKAATQGKVPAWFKYTASGWNAPGLGGKPSALKLPTYHLHSDAAYSTTKGKYVLTGYNPFEGRGVWVAFSTDGINWGKHSWIQHGRGSNDTLSPYVTIVDIDGTDNGEVGDSFYVYWAMHRPRRDRPPRPERVINQRLVRQKVTLIDP